MIGTLVMSPDYDAADTAPSNEVAACSYADACSDVPWQSFSMTLKKERLLGGLQSKYIRVGALSPNLDIKTYDSGNLFICMDASVANQTWGKLWVDYEVELLTPHTLPVPVASVYSNKINTGAFNPLQPWYLPSSAVTVASAGPIKIAPTNPLANGNNLTISGLTPGQVYRFIMEASAAAGKSVTSTTFSSLNALTELAQIVTNHTMTSAKGVCLESLMQATDTIASIGTILGGTDAVSYIGANLSVIPVSSGNTNAYSSWY